MREMETPPQWNRPRIIRRLQQLHKTHKDVSAAGCLTLDAEFGRRIYRVFKNHGRALMAAGIPPEEGSRRHFWTKEKVLAKLKARRDQGQELSFAGLMEDDPNLYGQTIKKFGSYAKAMAKLGLDVNAVRRLPRWSKRSIIARLRNLHVGGLEMRYGTVQEKYLPLLVAARRHFGSWDNALRAARLRRVPRKRPRQTRPIEWTKERLIAVLQERRSHRKSVRATAVRQQLAGVYYAARRRFGSYRAALRAAGVDDCFL